MGFSGSHWIAIRTEVLDLAETAADRATRIVLAAQNLRGRLAAPAAEETAIAYAGGR